MYECIRIWNALHKKCVSNKENKTSHGTEAVGRICKVAIERILL